MNYFELFEIPIQLQVNSQDLRKKFLELSRRYHPDFYVQSGEQEQAEVLEKSSQVNKAFKTFQDTDDTIKYVLQLKNLLEEEEKYELDPEFLMEVLELNEQVMELEMEPEASQLERVERQSTQLLDSIYAEVAQIIENYKDGVTTEAELLKVKDYYYKKKYLDRILDKLGQLRNIASP